MQKINIKLIKETESLNNSDNKIYALLLKSIQKYGQLFPLIVNNKYEIIKGNTIFKILKQLNFKDVWCNVVTDINEKQMCLELKLLKNEVNPIKCFKYMKDINKIDNCLPFNRNQVAEFINLLNFDWKQYRVVDSNINDFF